MNGNGLEVIEHARRAQVYARRGISPGSQKIFTLTEDERLRHGLARSDVRPCVTSLRSISSNLRQLDETTFQRYFVKTGRRCWLIRSTARTMSEGLRSYLAAIPENERNTYTCINQDPWHNYEEVDPPQLLLHSAFTGDAPVVLANEVQAIHVGVVYGIYGLPVGSIKKLQSYLLTCNVKAHVVPHAKTLRKIEVGQLNALLGDWWHVNAAA